jgi:hypothetical protein
MKTKTVTIYNWDGSQYDVTAPAEAKYLGILHFIGSIRFFRKKPKLSGYYYSDEHVVGDWLQDACPAENRPMVDGYGENGLPEELLLKIED